MTRYLTPPDLDDAGLAVALEPMGKLVLGQPEQLTVRYLDTFDWRLDGAGLTLVHEHGRHGHRLCLLEPGHEPLVVPIDTPPRLAADLPSGHLAHLVGPVMGIRALLTMGATGVTRRDGRIEDRHGDLTARLRLEEIVTVDDGGEPDSAPFTTLWIDDPASGAAAAAVARLTPTFDHDLELAAAARGRTPGDYSSKLNLRLAPDLRADRALRAILVDLLGTLERNVEGTIADLDSEFLHDLRVACRRSRSALTQVKGVLGPDVAEPANAELRWLGQVTGPLRDLDVYLLEMPTYRSLLPADAATELAPLEDLLVRSRTRAHRAAVRALESERFARFIAGWRTTLAGDEPSPAPEADRPIVEVADRRIAKAYRRIVRRGRTLDPDPPAACLHQLRIDAKKLRYLLEFFRSLYPGDEIGACIGELKRLQDILGGFNDMVVQRERLEGLAEELRNERDVAVGCLLSLGRLAGTLELRQEAFRLAFHDAFVDFASEPVRQAYHRLLGGKESP